LDLLGDPALGPAWDRPSQLAEWRVSGVAGHLARAVTTAEQYLDAEVPDAKRLTAGGYFARVVPTDDIYSDLHRTIRERGDEMSAEGPVALAERVAATLERLRQRLPAEPPQRAVAVLAGLVLSLDDYLATRVVELVVHCDDLALSMGVATPDFPVEPTDWPPMHSSIRRDEDTATLR